MDLDRFKDVNDVHGHRAGDALLQAVAAGLSETVRPEEFVARVGGDEFIAVKQIGDAAEALDFAHRLVGCITVPVTRRDRAFAIGASLGISLYPADADAVEELIGAADLAMYRAKRQAGRKICFYDQSMDEARR
jgi:diguanylate cyclase (GGDEF)-like protein